MAALSGWLAMPDIRRWPTLSIRASVLIGIALAVILPTAALWQMEERWTRKAQEPLVAQNRQAVLGLMTADLVTPLWTMDEAATLDRLKRGLLEPSVNSLRLTESRPLSTPVEFTQQGTVVGQGVRFQAEILHEGERLGELEIWFDPDQIEKALAERRAGTIQLAALQVLLSGLVLVVILTRRLLGPIERLKQQASQMASRGTVVPMDWNRRDELGQLGSHLNQVHAQVAELFDQLEGQKAELQRMALQDTLTGLPNRALFNELTRAAVATAQRDGKCLALLFIDLDRFKPVNDTYGHAAGDALLMALAKRLRAVVRCSDVVARLSGDEFTVLLHDASQWDQVSATADRVLKELEQPVSLQAGDVSVSASIGVAFYPADASDHETLVSYADTAMYAAKSMGGSRTSFFREEFNHQLQAALQLEAELRQALERDEFVLHYQPLVDARSGALMGCEALIRWQHPVRGLLSPFHFIPAAEQCGLISELGAWTIRHACQQIAAWKQAGLLFGTVAVNVSALEFRHHRLLDTLTSAIAEAGVRPGELEIELTESVLMTDIQTTQLIIERLHALGLPLFA
ncbi:MAG: hypothetical protein C4K60_08600 [Ideonella sp. MAG2]|nr:MAG: hypothetical protein C4K60_08600 [Ideonella sp. MAG2]